MLKPPPVQETHVTPHRSPARLGRGGRRVMGCFGLAFGSLFLIIGLWVISQGVSRGLKQQRTAGWPTVQGEITEVKLTRSKTEGPESPVMYEFTLDGKTYRSTRVAFIDRSNIAMNDWLQLANGLPRKGPVTVRYNPQDPNESVLHAGDHKASWEGVRAGAYFAGFAAVWMTLWWGMSNWLPNRLAREQELAAQ